MRLMRLEEVGTSEHLFIDIIFRTVAFFSAGRLQDTGAVDLSAGFQQGVQFIQDLVLHAPSRRADRRRRAETSRRLAAAALHGASAALDRERALGLDGPAWHWHLGDERGELL